MLTEIQELCRFDPLVRIQRTSINRPDIKLAIRCTQHSVDTLGDLDFLCSSEPVERRDLRLSVANLSGLLKHSALEIGWTHRLRSKRKRRNVRDDLCYPGVYGS